MIYQSLPDLYDGISWYTMVHVVYHCIARFTTFLHWQTILYPCMFILYAMDAHGLQAVDTGVPYYTGEFACGAQGYCLGYTGGVPCYTLVFAMI